MSEVITFLTLIVTVAGGTALLTAPADHSDILPLESERVALADGVHFAGSSGGIFIDAHVEGKHVRFMADTGASMTIISAADAAAIGIISRNSKEIRGIGGKIQASIAKVDLEIGGTPIADLDVAITDQVPHSLLGLDAMERLGQPRIVFQ